MLSFPEFEFASAPLTGASLFLEAVDASPSTLQTMLCGLTPFSEERVGKLRVSLVRNPPTWLVHYFESNSCWYKELDHLPRTSLGEFLESYLREFSGLVSEKLLSYKADTYMRAEDFPWCIIEFIESIGKPRPANLPDFTSLRSVSRIKDKELLKDVLKAEHRLVEAFDYF